MRIIPEIVQEDEEGGLWYKIRTDLFLKIFTIILAEIPAIRLEHQI